MPREARSRLVSHQQILKLLGYIEIVVWMLGPHHVEHRPRARPPGPYGAETEQGTYGGATCRGSALVREKIEIKHNRDSLSDRGSVDLRPCLGGLVLDSIPSKF